MGGFCIRGKTKRVFGAQSATAPAFGTHRLFVGQPAHCRNELGEGRMVLSTLACLAVVEGLKIGGYLETPVSLYGTQKGTT